MPEVQIHDIVSLSSYAVTFFVYSCITWITSRSLTWFLFRQQQKSVHVVPILTVHVITWWLCAIFGELVAFYKVVFWRPEPIYDKYTMFLLNLPMQLALNWVHISQFFITFERILIMKSINRVYHRKLVFWSCIFTNIVISLVIGVRFVVQFIPRANINDGCASISCLIDVNTYLMSYHISNAISVINLFASVYFLLLFQKSTTSTNTAGRHSTKILNIIKFTICVDICLDILPQMVSIILSFCALSVLNEFKYLTWILFTVCGVFVNRHIYKALVVDARVSVIKSTSTFVIKPK